MVLPLGFRFRPTDVELICHYLRRKVLSQDLPSDAVEDGDDVYNVEPWSLPRASTVSKNGGGRPMMKQAEALYFFVSRKRRTENGSRPDRRAGKGFWRAAWKNQEGITDERGRVIGLKKGLSYVLYADEKQSSKGGIKTEWVMHEYALFDVHAPNKFQEWTLCRISETRRPSSKRPRDSHEGCSYSNIPQISSADPLYQMEETEHQQQGQEMNQQVQDGAMVYIPQSSSCNQIALQIEDGTMVPMEPNAEAGPLFSHQLQCYPLGIQGAVEPWEIAALASFSSTIDQCPNHQQSSYSDLCCSRAEMPHLYIPETSNGQEINEQQGQERVQLKPALSSISTSQWPNEQSSYSKFLLP